MRLLHHNARRGGEAAHALRTLGDLASTLAGAADTGAVTATVADAARTITGFEHAAVWLANERGPAEPTRTAIEAFVNSRLAADRSDDDGEMAEVAVPMVAGGRVLGVVAVWGEPRPVADDLVDVLGIMAANAAAAVNTIEVRDRADQVAQVDPLTGLLNRRRLDADLRLECERSRRHRRPLALVMIDVDHFKQFNDEHGHLAGDEALRQVAAALADSVRASDTAYRYGGEEFAVLVREGTSTGAAELAERLRAAVSERGVTASFGVASAPDDGRTPTELVSAADLALYTAKRRGRNRVAVSGVSEEPDRVVGSEAAAAS